MSIFFFCFNLSLIAPRDPTRSSPPGPADPKPGKFGLVVIVNFSTSHIAFLAL